jgi:hypothetical protein
VGRYFKTKSGSRDLRSGLYVFDCPKLKEAYTEFPPESKSLQYTFIWLKRLVKVRIMLTLPSPSIQFHSLSLFL